MKVVKLSNQTFLVRHWFVWYRVQRSGQNWTRLGPLIKMATAPKFSIEKAAADLGGGSAPIDLTE